MSHLERLHITVAKSKKSVQNGGMGATLKGVCSPPNWQLKGIPIRNIRKSILRILESSFLTTGVILLAAFVLIRGWGDYQSWSDIRAFEEAMALDFAPSGQATAAAT